MPNSCNYRLSKRGGLENFGVFGENGDTPVRPLCVATLTADNCCRHGRALSRGFLAHSQKNGFSSKCGGVQYAISNLQLK